MKTQLVKRDVSFQGHAAFNIVVQYLDPQVNQYEDLISINLDNLNSIVNTIPWETNEDQQKYKAAENYEYSGN